MLKLIQVLMTFWLATSWLAGAALCQEQEEGSDEDAPESGTDEAAIAKPAKAPKTAADIPGGKVVRIKDKRMIIRWKGHGLKKGDRFYVLNNVATGILAELEVSKLGKKRKQLFEARILDNPLGVKNSTLFNAKAIKIQDAERNPTLFPDGPIKMQIKVDPKSLIKDPYNPEIYLNPTARLRFGLRQGRSLGAPVVTDTDVNVPLRMTEIGFDAFLPPLTEARWLNGFGLDVAYEPVTTSKVSFRASGTEIVQEASLERSRLIASVLFRPSFKNRFLSRLGVRISPLDTTTETFDLSASDSVLSSPAAKEELTIKGVTLALEYEAALFPNFFVGFAFVPPLKQTAVLSSATSGSEKLSTNGTFSAQSIIFDLGSRYSLLGGRPRDLTFEVRGQLDIRKEQLDGFKAISPSLGPARNDVRLGAYLGVGYVN